MYRKAIVFSAVLALISMISMTAGCTENKTDIVNRTNAIYKNIKVIVTDPEISAMLSEETRESLRNAERVYLEAVQDLEQVEDLASTPGKNALLNIVSCADILLGVIDTLDVLDKYEPVITAARISVKLLRTNMAA